MIHAQHGTRRAPHIFFDVMTDERYSETLDKHFMHKILRIGYNYNGPTEIGGLVLHPSYRRKTEALGRHFTGMSYQEADRVSQSNKEFIRALFPADSIYISLLPYSVQGLIGQVGPETKGVEKMLRRIGFEYANRIDPFDGGPHFIAKTDDITLVKTSRTARVVPLPANEEGTQGGLVSIERDRAPHFSACGSRFRLEGTDVGLPAATMKQLGLAAGDSVGVLPF